jgi:protein-S-isoprenylcysteine O-methyltransferase Ste14
MRAMGPKMESVDVAVRLAVRTPRQVPAAASLVRGLIPERWVVQWISVAVAALLVGVAALTALAIMSTRAPAADSALGTVAWCERHAAESGAVDVCRDPEYCGEVW